MRLQCLGRPAPPKTKKVQKVESYNAYFLKNVNSRRSPSRATGSSPLQPLLEFAGFAARGVVLQ
jgi:hypothetical protein